MRSVKADKSHEGTDKFRNSFPLIFNACFRPATLKARTKVPRNKELLRGYSAMGGKKKNARHSFQEGNSYARQVQWRDDNSDQWHTRGKHIYPRTGGRFNSEPNNYTCFKRTLHR